MRGRLPFIIIGALILIVVLTAQKGGAQAVGLAGRRLSEKELNQLSRQWANIQGNLEPEEIKAIIMIESSGFVEAVNPNDPSFGLMQVTRLIGKAFGGITEDKQLFDVQTNLKAGTGFLSELKQKYAVRFPLSDPKNGWVQMYNTGEPLFLNKGVRNVSYQEKFVAFTARFRPDFF